ncbi:glycosyltransferase family 21 protein [Thelephora ganbajun]|uniref:Glycosyltransferase family 21 protein n=1 Tax=Thelephora ganbajun TaxID=370292 RepID=A0ACB6ZR43_THEGA|nr:glycosyltransferase family 21 protein [Thelephora ganbajun]
MESDTGQSPLVTSSTVRYYLSIVCLGWYAVHWSLQLVGMYAARRRYRSPCPRSPSSSAPPESVPGVSILRPLKGLDTNLFENLESTFRQEYPNFEIIFSVANEYDQALPVVQALLEKYPNSNARVIIGEEVVGVNPKVNNLIRPYREAKHDILWVLDSNVTISPGALARAVDILTTTPGSGKKISLVHHVPFATVSTPTLGAKVEEAFLNTTHAKMYIAINTLALDSCVMGKSNLYRRSDVDRLDGSLKPHTGDTPNPSAERGLRAFGKYLAEDNMIASGIWHELGLRHDLSCDVAHNAIGDMSLKDYILRRIRWIRVRKHMVLSATLLEPLTESIALGTIAALSVRSLFDISYLFFLSCHFSAWLFVDLDVYCSIAGHPPPQGSRTSFFVAWMVRELLAFPIWLYAVVGNQVMWRGKKYKMLRNGEVEAVKPSAISGLESALTWLGARGRKSLDQYEPLPLSHS